VFTSEHYAARANDLEAAAELISDENIRATYLALAKNFRRKFVLARIAESRSPETKSSQQQSLDP
jgi:hypothetical protein